MDACREHSRDGGSGGSAGRGAGPRQAIVSCYTSVAMPMRLHDTLTGELRPLRTGDDGSVRLYVCGPTVQDVMHLGHVRATVVYDVLVRHLRRSGVKVRFVRNVTDVNDTIVEKAKKAGEEPGAYARRIEALWQEDFARLGLLPPDVEPHVTDHMPEIVALIEKLVAKGHAYPSGGDVYFRVSSFPEYGKLSHRKLDELAMGASGRTSDEEAARKEHPADFALWKASGPGEQGWPSPWGHGRPGWHIECSAMAMKHLGETLDLHAGGLDLVFPHHENEIAQSEAATGKTYARHWMHHGFIEVNKEKMSKSLGNFFTLRDIVRHVEPEAVRWFVLSTTYRAPLNFEWNQDEAGGTTRFPQLEEAERRVEYFYATRARLAALPSERVVDALPGKDGETPAEIAGFEASLARALDDDLNFAQAQSVVAEMLRAVNELVDRALRKNGAASRAAVAAAEAALAHASATLGVGGEDPATWLGRVRDRRARARGVTPEQVEARIAERLEARQARDFARADAIRDALLAAGVELMDGPNGTTWRIPR
jgi:cysteinyl-tRNA synthetase